MSRNVFSEIQSRPISNKIPEKWTINLEDAIIAEIRLNTNNDRPIGSAVNTSVPEYVFVVFFGFQKT